MSENEIRLILRDLIADLDRRAIRRLGKVLLPSMLGASLALTGGGCGNRTVPQQTDSTTITADSGVPLPDSTPLVDGAPVADGALPTSDSAPAADTRPDPPPVPVPMYGVPFPEPDGGI